MHLIPAKRGVYCVLPLGKHCGIGEAAPLPGFSHETVEAAIQELKSGIPLCPSAHFAWESALNGFEDRPPFDLPPLCRYVEDVNHFDRKAVHTLKLKLGHLTPEEAIKTVHQILPFTKHLRVDINRRWNLDQAQCFLQAFHPSTFEYIEEPVDRWEDLTKLFDYPIAIDEHLRERTVDEILRHPFKAAVIKPTLIGGLSRLTPLCHALKDHGIYPVFSSSYESPIALYHILQLHCQLASIKVAIGIDTLEKWL